MNDVREWAISKSSDNWMVVKEDGGCMKLTTMMIDVELGLD